MGIADAVLEAPGGEVTRWKRIIHLYNHTMKQMYEWLTGEIRSVESIPADQGNGIPEYRPRHLYIKVKKARVN